jgi:hypothetical protein
MPSKAQEYPGDERDQALWKEWAKFYNIHGWHMKSDVRNVAVATDRLEINDVINICKYNGTERVFS